MGLDVYLYWYKDHTAYQKAEKEAEKFEKKEWDKLYKKYANGKQDNEGFDKIPEKERDACYARIDAKKKELGCGEEYDEVKSGKCDFLKRIELDSKVHPEHMFKVGYMRSSYNGSGIDNVLHNLLGVDLATMFGNTDREYHFQPDWAETLKRVRGVIADLQEKGKDGYYRSSAERANEFFGPPSFEHPIQSEEAAMKAWKDGAFPDLDSKWQGTPESLAARKKERAHLLELDLEKDLRVVKFGAVRPTAVDSRGYKVNSEESAMRYFEELREKYKSTDEALVVDDQNFYYKGDKAQVVGLIHGITPVTAKEFADAFGAPEEFVRMRAGNRIAWPCLFAVVYVGKKPWPKPHAEMSMGSFSNREGSYMLAKPIPLTALIQGVQKRFFVEECLPCYYLIYEDSEGMQWYREALEVVTEMCEWVLGQPDKEKYWLHWSG